MRAGFPSSLFRLIAHPPQNLHPLSIAGSTTIDIASAAHDSPKAQDAAAALSQLLPEAIALLQGMASQLQVAAGATSDAVLAVSISICSEGGEGVVEALEMACSHRHGGQPHAEAGWRGRVEQLLQEELSAQGALLQAQRLDWGCLCTMSGSLAAHQGAVLACWNPGCAGGSSSSSSRRAEGATTVAGGGLCKGCGHAFFCCKLCEVQAGIRGHYEACKLLCNKL